MHFDVILGNPPYQQPDGGAQRSAIPLYHHFVRLAKQLQPRYITMIIPARWFTGGRNIDDFRHEMLNDTRLKYICDYADSKQVFPDMDIAGGILYFLWDSSHNGQCLVTTHLYTTTITTARTLNEYPVFIRDPRALSIIHKIPPAEMTFQEIVSRRNPFNVSTLKQGTPDGDLYLFAYPKDSRIHSTRIRRNTHLINQWKVLLACGASDHAGSPTQDNTRKVFARLEVMPPGSVCTDTYLCVGSFDSEVYANNLLAYLRTRFLRFLVSQVAITQRLSRGKFRFVPIQDFSTKWTDEMLYSKYNLSQDEINLIQSSIRPMPINPQ